MEELFNILSEGKAHVRVEMDAADLKAFSDELIRRAKDELGSMVEAARKAPGAWTTQPNPMSLWRIPFFSLWVYFLRP